MQSSGHPALPLSSLPDVNAETCCWAALRLVVTRPVASDRAVSRNLTCEARRSDLQAAQPG